MSENDENPVDQEVQGILSRANLARVRGQADSAIALCQQALHLEPQCAAAHALLGDIYEGKGDGDAAFHHYSMAVDLRPDSPSDRARLDKAIRTREARLRAEQQRATKAPPAAAVPATPTASEPLKPRRRVAWTWIVAILGGALLAIALGYGVGNLIWGREEPLKPTNSPRSTLSTPPR